MSITDFIKKINDKGININVIGKDLNVIAQKGAIDNEILIEIKKYKQDLLRMLQTPIPKAAVKESYELTPSQKRFWVLSQFEGGNLAYNIPMILEFEGNLLAEELEEAFKIVIERHESLRTSFNENEENEVRQYIVPAAEIDFSINIYDLSESKFDEVEKRKLIEQEYETSFDLSKAPLLRVSLIKISSDKHLLFYSLHHIIGDGWSMEVLTKEITYVYNCLVESKNIELPILQNQYKDYAEWCNNKVEELKDQETFWLNKLSGELPVLNIPISHRRPLTKTYNGDNILHQFSKEFTAKIKSFSEHNGVTLFTSLMAGINGLLYRYTNERDIIIGIPIAGREHPRLENQVGLYLNTLAIRTRFKKSTSFKRLLEIQKEELFQAYKHQDYPFDQLVNKLNVDRDTSRSPLFDVMAVLQNQKNININSDAKLNEIKVENYDKISRGVSQFDLTFSFRDIEESLSLDLEYNTDLFNKKTIQKLSEHLEIFLLSVMNNPSQEIQSVTFISEAETNQLLNQFNNTEISYPDKDTVVSLLENRALKTPGRTAFVFNKKSISNGLDDVNFEQIEISYEKLRIISNQFADFLITEFDIQNHELVGVVLEKSEWLIPILLGILKAGAAYVPIDPSYPEERIKYFTDFTDCRVNIDDEILLRFIDNIKGYSKSLPDIRITPDHLVHVMFTSGSTGIPKGVMLSHRNIAGFVKPCTYMNLTSDTILLSTVSVSFDTTNMEFWGALINEAKVILVKKQHLLSPSLFKQIIKINNVDTMFLTASWFENVVDEDFTIFEGIKQFLTGGEIVSIKHINFLAEKYPELKIIHCYGPCEDTTFSTTYIVDKKFENIIPIGKPLDNSQSYILNEDLQIQPIGIPGILYLGGIGVSQGYYKNEILTNQKFMDNPFTGKGKMYNTGDYAKWNEDGNIIFIGRIDRQVKIRGKIIDTSEIENVLNSFLDINQSLVEVKLHKNEKKIIAYIACNKKVDLRLIKKEIKNNLPSFMIPQIFIEIPVIPLSPNGKADRSKLPNIEDYDSIAAEEYVSPRNAIEEKLVTIWREILQKDKIGIKEDFFDLGGHSLKATRLIGEYHKVFKVKLGLVELFTHTTLESHSSLIESSVKDDYLEIEKIKDAESYVISDAQKRLWVLSQFEEGSAAFNIPSFIELHGDYDVNSFKKAIFSVIDRHEILRTLFRTNNSGDVKQWILPIEEIGFTIDYHDFREKINKEALVRSYIQQDSYKTFNLEKGPLIRSSLLQLSHDKYVFYYNMHHIISDGWSMDVLARDVFAFYEAYKDDKTPNLPNLRIQYKDYACWQLEQLKKHEFKTHQNYWLNKLSGELPLLDLPSSKLRPKVKTHQGRSLRTYISKKDNLKLKNYVYQNGGTLFMGLLTSLKVLFYRYTNNEDIIIGTPIAGRDHADLENQIGFYVNTLALRNQVKDDDSFDELFSRVKESTLEAYSHQSYPFDRLVEDLELKRNTSRSAIFDVLLVLQNTGDELEDVKLDEELINQITHSDLALSKVDITFNFQEVGDYLSFNITYNTDVYEKETIESFMKHYKQLLSEILDSPKNVIKTINYLTAEEHYKLLNRFNDTDVKYPKNKTVLDLFEEQVYKTPDNIAVIYEEKQLTYKDLNIVSNQLAHYLREKYNIQPDDLLGIQLERSDWIITAMLGILKAGGAYVPIDPSYPQERIDYMLKDSNCKVLIDSSEIKLFKKNINHYKKENLSKQITWNNLVYVIYTSGSTGKPKGVMIENRGLINHINWFNRDFSITDKDSTVLITSYAFDGSVTSVWSSLLTGSTLHIVQSKLAQNPEECLDYIEKKGISFLKLVPSLFSSMVNTNKFNSSSCLKSVRFIKLGGENIVVKDLKKCFEKYPAIRFANHYGATEASIGSVIYHISKSNFETFAKKPVVGTPFDNFRIYILDDHFQLLPVGVIGNIYIAGDGVSRGYLNREELNKEKFISGLFQEEKLYKTGDLGAWTPEGTIIFKGRNDNQVKIRGYRIELEEIESILLTGRDILEALVIESDNGLNEKELVAYIVSSRERNHSELRTYLKQFLPDFMIPAYFVQLEKFPLTSNGKVDKKLLPNPEEQNVESGKVYVQPKNETEEKLVIIWEEILGKNNISTTDNFFELGGHSLKVVRLINSIEKIFDIKLKMELIFLQPTIIEICEELDRITWLKITDKTKSTNSKVIEL